MLELPVELQRNCFEFLTSDPTTLKAVRLVNKLLNELATETLFHTVSFTNIKNSPPRFAKIVGSSLRKHIRHVVINTSDDPDRKFPGIDAPKAKIRRAFRDAIELLPQLERLDRVDLRFSCWCRGTSDWGDDVPEDIDFRAEINELCFQAFARCEKIKSLEIENLQDSMDGLTHPESFLPSVRGRLTELHLKIASQKMEARPEEDIDEEGLHQGLTCYLPNHWLKPTTNQLTRLRLECDVYWGVWPFTDFREIPPFPHLKSMCFGMWTIAHDWQVDWIIAHGATLETLLLPNCSVVRGLHMIQEQAEANFPQIVETEPSIDLSTLYAKPGTYDVPRGIGYPEYDVEVDLRWHQILERFRVGLRRLRYFAFYYGQHHAFGSRYDRYIFFDYTIMSHCGICDPWDPYNVRDNEDENEDLHEWQDPDCDEQDERAFLALAEAIQQRTSTTKERS